MVAANPQKLMGSAANKTVQTAVVQPQKQLIAAPADTAALQDISKSLARITQLLTELLNFLLNKIYRLLQKQIKKEKIKKTLKERK
jgi:hypothetical protein